MFCEISTQFYTIHLFPVSVLVLVLSSVNKPLLFLAQVYDTETSQWTELENWESSPYLWLTSLSFVHKEDIYILGEGT